MRAVLDKLFGRVSAAKFTLRAAKPEDLPVLSAILAECAEAAHWNPADFFAYSCDVAVLDGYVAGFAVWRETCPGETEILNLAVQARFRRRGVAAALLRSVIRTCPGEIFLEVRESNKAARRLYHSLGFKEAGIRPEYYEEPPEAAIVMRILS